MLPGISQRIRSVSKLLSDSIAECCNRDNYNDALGFFNIFEFSTFFGVFKLSVIECRTVGE